MNASRLLAAFAVFCLHGRAEAGPWKVVRFGADPGIVSGIALGPDGIAVGSTSGAVSWIDPATSKVRPLVAAGAGGVQSLEWFRDRLWIATRNGLRISAAGGGTGSLPAGIAEAFRGGGTVLRLDDGALWCASRRKVARISSEGSVRSWEAAFASEPTGVIRAGTRVLVGTVSDGIQLLDTATGRWTSIGDDEGLSSRQVTAMERIGGELFVATSDGVDALDLSTLRLRPVATGFAALWMTQANGVLYASTLDGLRRIDPAADSVERAEVPDGFRAEGSVLFAGGLLVVGGGGTMATRSLPTFLGSEGFRAAPEGIRLRIPEPLPRTVSLRAQVGLPEWPAAKAPVPVAVTGGDGREILISLPRENLGRVQVDLSALFGERVLEVRTMDDDGDRSRPVLVVDPVPSAGRSRSIRVSGVVSGVAPLSLEIVPGNRPVAIGRDGRFQAILGLEDGENRFEVRLRDGLGAVASRSLRTFLGDRPIRVESHVFDTADADRASVRIPFRGGDVHVRAVPPIGTELGVFDSFVVFQTGRLGFGENAWRLVFEDGLGAPVCAIVHVFRRSSSAGRGTAAFDWRETDSVRDPVPTERPRVIRCRADSGQTLQGLAKRFYGSEDLVPILARWNGLDERDGALVAGTPVEIPVWRDIDQGAGDARRILSSFPWKFARSRPEEAR